MSQDLSWEEAIQSVLQDSGGALRCVEIAERVSLQKLRASVGANPAAAVAAILSKSLGDPETPFHRVARGEYTLKSLLEQGSAPENSAATTQEEETSETGALRAFGMYWKRDAVIWRGKPKLLGRQGIAASQVNFAGQIGVYLLHDRDRVIYVGRATESLVTRLLMHTIDRLSGRWDRFSWFGLRNVGPNGQLLDTSVPWDQTVVIETLEALLIESLEPPLNRRRGDNFSGVEYLQVVDPDIERIQQRRVIDQLARSINAGGDE
ncbi:MAG: HTH domain-containing protein [Sphingomonas sp.]